MRELRASSFRARQNSQLQAATAASCKPQLQPTTARRNCKRWLPWQLSGTHPYPCNYFNMRGIAETSGAWSDLLAPRCRQRQYWSPSSCIQDKGDYITAAGGTHPSHVIIVRCVGLRKRRARDRICLHVMFADPVPSCGWASATP